MTVPLLFRKVIRMRRSTPVVALAAVVLSAAFAAQRRDAFVESRDHTAIAYSNAVPSDAISTLNGQLQRGAAQLRFDPVKGYLRSVLDALKVPVESQALVFSQTSFQGPLINIHNPRALYFNDTVAVGWVRGGKFVEVAVQDPRQGVIFYALDQQESTTPQFKRNDECLACHLSWDTLGVPGFFVMSMYPLPDDKNAYATGFTSDHRSPFSERWGGWYVTGDTGGAAHMGNVPVMPADQGKSKPADPLRPLASLDGLFDLNGYLSPYSDVVALMVLAHQTHMTNLITRVGWEERVRLQTPSRDGAERVESAAEDLVNYMLFVDEARPANAIRGSSGFAEQFAAKGPRDINGRSLRQFDLEKRLFRYPCSYMIYSEAFNALPSKVKEGIYERMWQILSGQDRQQRYSALSLPDRQAIVEILRNTKKDLPSFFQPVTR
jgi:hypothetical protein